MKIWFWTMIVIMTLAAWGCLLWPFYFKSASKSGIWIKIGLSIFPVAALGAYLFLGDSHRLQEYWAAQRQGAQIQQEMATLKSPQELIDRMRSHLEQNPNSGEGWFLLGKLYLDQRQYANAESALARARSLQPNSGETVVALAKANFFHHQGHLTPAMEAAVSGVLESLKEPVEALNLLAVNAYRRKDFHAAVAYWQRALALIQPDSPDSRTLLAMISEAQHQETGADNGRKD
jgi:cytochrome c-type biogenesis protein CcmH